MAPLTTSSEVAALRRQWSHSPMSVHILKAALLLALLLLGACSSVSLAVDAVEKHPVTAREGMHAQFAWPASAAVTAALDMKGSDVHVLRKQLVREVNHQNWHLLDGDLLIPADAKNVARLHPRRDAPLKGVLECGSSPSQAAEARAEVDPHSPLAGVHRAGHVAVDTRQDSTLAGERHRRTEHHAHVTSSRQQHKTIADEAVVDAAEKYTEAQPSRITLDSLRLLILFKNEAADEEEGAEGHEHGDDKHAATHSRGSGYRRWRGRNSNAYRGQSFSVSPGQQGDGERRVATASKPITAKVAAELHDMARRCDGRDAALVSRDAKGASTMQIEELWRRCLVASTRDSKGALITALQEGSSREHCLIVVADVGNDIPRSGNNAKGDAAILSLLVSILFGAFLFLF
ncbi:hypothetical protein GH5_05596 [Leishmania sp. Ghana 2012 LV757]|uniref:hypothetical protein n=1 Tax=Leishmania sp. Ghana 2012 LV757 TaxID=2803181 RepID=UPI001B526CA3|nr:hypothetical protein GH5_05596 [Leishmania sp. Ghana 2012 LV757]